jgi:hypothetical protein
VVNDPGLAPLAAKRLVRATSIALQPIIDALALAVLRDSQQYRLTYKLTTYLDRWILREPANLDDCIQCGNYVLGIPVEIVSH